VNDLNNFLTTITSAADVLSSLLRALLSLRWKGGIKNMAGPYKVPSSHQGSAKPANQAAHPTNNGDAISHKAESSRFFTTLTGWMFWIPNSRTDGSQSRDLMLGECLKSEVAAVKIVKGKESGIRNRFPY